MKGFFEKINFKKSIALFLTFCTLFLVSCGDGAVSSEDVSTKSLLSAVIQNSPSFSESDGEALDSSDIDVSASQETSDNGSDESDTDISDISADTSDESLPAFEDESEEPSTESSGEINDNISNDATSEGPSSEEASSEEPSSEEASSEEPSSDDKPEPPTPSTGVGNKSEATANLDKIPAYTNKNYIAINNNIPYFSAQQLSTKGYETYGDLDSLGRCTYAIASCGKDTLPTTDRGSISSVKPTGWIQANYSCIKTKDLYNRSHLIAWSLTGEDANKQNLVTGTAHLNQTVMTEFEDMILDYIKETGNHVAYRVTPLFKGNDLVCRGVQMEAYSVEDNGEAICFNVFCYNVQPGVIIDYATGKSQAENPEDEPDDNVDTTIKADYVLNTKSKKIHLPNCSSVSTMSEKNKQAYNGTIDSLLNDGYTRCGSCLAQ